MPTNEEKPRKTWIMYKKPLPLVIDYMGNPWGDGLWEVYESYVTGSDSHCNIKCTSSIGVWKAEVTSSSFGKAEKDATQLFDNNVESMYYVDSPTGNSSTYMTVVITPPDGSYINVSSLSVEGDYAQGSYFIDVYVYDKNNIETKVLNEYCGNSTSTSKRVLYNKELNIDTDIYASKIKLHMYMTSDNWGNFHVNEIKIIKSAIMNK